MATPPQEIEKQHKEAERLLKEGASPAERVNHGEIPLSAKQCPIADLFPLEDATNKHDASSQQPTVVQKEDFFPCWTSRGEVDVKALDKIVREGYNSIPAPPPKKQAPPSSSSSSVSSSASSTNNNSSRSSALPKRKRYQAKDIQSTTNLWDPANAAVNNVSIHRPSHDAWGINKIVLVFSDDFLQQRYHLPWWHLRSDLKEAIMPILNLLQVDETCVVRMLLASLPPGVTIPVHHDSGEWVKHTHRVHVPIILEETQILFQCGLSADSMERIDCKPGHVFEINNQAKHAVSNCSSDHRVHLILDYVDKGFEWKTPSPVLLEPGEVVLQTRRSLDRLKDRGHRETPSFMILGAQKAGTTSLYEYICQHPLVVRPRRRETHCLDWRWNPELQTAEQQKAWCHKFYFTEELQYYPSCITGDSTPSYLLDSRRVLPRLRRVFSSSHVHGSMRFFVMLREPIQRAESHYAMVTSPHGTAAQLKTRGSEWRSKTIEQVVQDELEKMKACGLLPHWDLTTKTFDQQVFDSFAGSAAEDEAWDLYLSRHVPLNTGSYGLLTRGLYELQLRQWLGVIDASQFLVLKLESFNDSENNSGAVSSTMQRVWKHLDLPAITLADETRKNSREYESQLGSELRSFLEAFYAPYNRRLQELLCQHGWDDDKSSCWTYES